MLAHVHWIDGEFRITLTDHGAAILGLADGDLVEVTRHVRDTNFATMKRDWLLSIVSPICMSGLFGSWPKVPERRPTTDRETGDLTK